jgi:hypothetical protein
VVTRADLSPGVQIAQAVHAAIEYTKEHDPPLVLAVLAARDEIDLVWLVSDAVQLLIPYTSFHEPDLDDALTAVALGPQAARLCRRFPLALGGR